MSTATPKLDTLADHLADALVDRVAERLAVIIAERDLTTPPTYIDAAEVAKRLGITRSSVYELADELGAIRLGDGERPRLRFDPRRIDAYGASEPPAKPTGNGSGRRRTRGTAPLLPVKGARP